MAKWKKVRNLNIQILFSKSSIRRLKNASFSFLEKLNVKKGANYSFCMFKQLARDSSRVLTCWGHTHRCQYTTSWEREGLTGLFQDIWKKVYFASSFFHRSLTLKNEGKLFVFYSTTINFKLLNIWVRTLVHFVLFMIFLMETISLHVPKRIHQHLNYRFVCRYGFPLQPCDSY